MSTSRLVTKKRRSNDDHGANLTTQRSIRHINTSTIIRPRKMPDLSMDVISRTRKTRANGSIRPRKLHDFDDADCLLFQELPDSESCMWLSSGSGRSSSPPSFLEDPGFDPLSSLDMSAWKRLLFVWLLFASSKSSFQGRNGVFPGLMKKENLGFDKCVSFGSLVNLEEETSDWGSGTESEVDFLLPDFPSKSYKRSTIVSNMQAFNSRTSGDVEETGPFPFDVDVDMEEDLRYMDDGDEPLFWPPGLKAAWFSEPGSNFLAMSPPKKKLKKGIDAIEVEESEFSKVEEVNLDEVSIDEPLVWPSGKTFDWSPEVAWNFFNMSPSRRKRKVEGKQNKLELEPFDVDKNSTKMMVDFEDLNQGELLVWPSDEKLDWNSEAVFNLFIMSPLKRRQNRNAGMDYSGVEPLFWPSDSAFDWDYEAARNFFAMSPRRGKKISFEASITKKVQTKANRKRSRGIGGVIVSPRVVELRNGSGGSKGVVRTKSMPSNMRKCSSFARK